jgi:ankyrin repeat protein
MVGKQPKRKPRPGVDGYGRTPLHYACGDGDSALCAALLAEGADPNIGDDNGWTPLHFAAQSQNPGVVKLLLDAGAHLETRDSFGNTPLWRATFTAHGRGDVILLLPSAGADVNAQNKYGHSPLSMMKEESTSPTAQFFADSLD